MDRARAAMADLERRLAANGTATVSHTAGLGCTHGGLGLGASIVDAEALPSASASPPLLPSGSSRAPAAFGAVPPPAQQADDFLATLTLPGPQPPMHASANSLPAPWALPPAGVPPPPPPPPALPAGWEAVHGATGTYYFNRGTGETTWTKPNYAAPAAQLAPMAPSTMVASVPAVSTAAPLPAGAAAAAALPALQPATSAVPPYGQHAGVVSVGSIESARATALAAAQQIADSLTAALPRPPAVKTLDEVLARDRARVAAAEQRNLKYVRDQHANAKAKAKAAAAAAANAEAASREGGSNANAANGVEGGASSRGSASAAPDGPPPAKMARLAPRSGAGGAAACSVYVAGLPLDLRPEELEDCMGKVGPITRVKIYRDEAGRAKGDALVTYQKDAAVIGAIQLLNRTEVRPGHPLTISRPVWGSEAQQQAALLATRDAAPPSSNAPPASHGISKPARLIPGLAPHRTAVADVAAAAPPAPPKSAPATASGSSSAPSDEMLRVVVVRRFFLPSEVPPASNVAARRAWVQMTVDDLWEEACRHGEVPQSVASPDLRCCSTPGPALVLRRRCRPTIHCPTRFLSPVPPLAVCTTPTPNTAQPPKTRALTPTPTQGRARRASPRWQRSQLE